MIRETRSLDTAIELRNDDDDTEIIAGVAAPFESYSVDFGDWKEKIASTAFDETLTKVADGKARVSFLWGHDSKLPLGSTRSGKLSLSKSDAGLEFEADGSALTDLMRSAVNDGEMQMSIGFSVIKDSWERVEDSKVEYVRTLESVELHEISLVLDPAYPDTSAAKRSLDAFKSKDKIRPEISTADQLRKLQFLQVRLRTPLDK